MIPLPPHIYTIAPDRPFLATLAHGLLALAGGDPLSLPRMTVLLPTRRAARSLREAVLRLTAEGKDPGAPLLLPRLRPIGDLDDDEIALGFGSAEGGDSAGAEDPTLAIPPAIPELRRRLLLTQLVLAWSEASGDALPAAKASYRAASSLTRTPSDQPSWMMPGMAISKRCERSARRTKRVRMSGPRSRSNE